MYWDNHLTKLSATEVVYSSEIDGISRQTLTTSKRLRRQFSASSMSGKALTSTSTPTLKDNGLLVLENTGFAIGDALTTYLAL